MPALDYYLRAVRAHRSCSWDLPFIQFNFPYISSRFKFEQFESLLALNSGAQGLSVSKPKKLEVHARPKKDCNTRGGAQFKRIYNLRIMA